jgi:hypothetical protein
MRHPMLLRRLRRSRPKSQVCSTEETAELNEWYALAPDHSLFAVARVMPDRVYIQRHDLDGVAVAIFRVGSQGPSVIARQDFRGLLIRTIEWSPDSKFLLFTTSSAGGHSAWHAAAFLFNIADDSFRDVDAAIGSVASPKFRFEPPDVATMVVKKRRNAGRRGEDTTCKDRAPDAAG